MKKLIVTVTLVLSLLACSAAQKQAELELGGETTLCLLGKVDRPFAQALEECGLSTLTDPVKRAQIERMFVAAQAGARKAGAQIPAEQ